jgi:hypothetical protein
MVPWPLPANREVQLAVGVCTGLLVKLMVPGGCVGCRHIAAAEGAFSVVQWLIEAGADVNPLDRHNRTPLEVCPGPWWQQGSLQQPCYSGAAWLYVPRCSCAPILPHILEVDQERSFVSARDGVTPRERVTRSTASHNGARGGRQGM